MFTFNVRKLFRNTFGSWQSATPPQAAFKPRLEVLEDRWLPSGMGPDAATSLALFWDPTVPGNVAFNAKNWDVGTLGSGKHPAAAPGDNLNELDSIIFDGTNQFSNSSCNWTYTPLLALGAVTFQNGYNRTVSFDPSQGFSVQGGGAVTGTSAPTITPNGSNGSSSKPAITLTNGSYFSVANSSTLILQGYSSGNAVFMAGDGTAGEYLTVGGTVSYLGAGTTGTANTDYLKIPVDNGGIFKVNGNGNGTTTLGSVLQVSGADAAHTNNVSFYQADSGTSETDISGNGTLWCFNNFTMTKGKFQTTDAYKDTLKVGTASSDGTATLLGGTVNINPGANKYGTLNIKGSTDANNPTVNVGGATLNFKLNKATGSTQCDQLIVGNGSSGGTINFGLGGATATVAFSPQGSGTGGNVWQPILFNKVTKTTSVTFTPGFTENWLPTYLKVEP